MAIQHAVLALLAQKESYGYELKSNFERAMGPQWGELNIGHLYQVLDRLVRDGLATYRVVRQTDRPDKHIYRLTKSGRAELREWLATPFVRAGGHRDELFLKLFAAAWLGADQLREVARRQRGAYLDELHALSELRSNHSHDPLVELLIKAATLHTRANLDVVESAERRAGTISEAMRVQGKSPRPAMARRDARSTGRRSSEPRRRGRAG